MNHSKTDITRPAGGTPPGRTGETENVTGGVFEIERWSLADGPGTRTVVFLQGCPLRCAWCANPESQSPKPQMGIFPAKCVTCDKCVEACPRDVARPGIQGGFSGEVSCIGCGACIEVCPSRCRRWMGEAMTAEAVLDTLKKDMIFYRKSGGGVTFSGGEPFNQPRFLGGILAGCNRLGIHTAVETCGCFDWEGCREIIDRVDFVMFDLKHMDTARHRELTGVGNELILDNVRRLSELDVPLLIRIPVIPGLNDDEENIVATARFVKEELPSAVGLELLPYHNLGATKYAALGIQYQLNHIKSPTDEQMARLKELVRESGLPLITPDSRDHDTTRPRLHAVV